MAVGVVNLSNPYDVKYASVNGNYMMYAASLPKIAILLSAMDAIQKGEIKETADVKTDMRLMIAKSDNHAATRMINRLGYQKHLSHAASVNQVCRYYYLLANGKLVNYERSKQMLDIMGNPDLHHKFVAVLEKIAPQAKLFRKSGTWKTYHSDSILVWGADTGRRYILVALIDDPRGGQIIKDLVYPVEKVLKITKSKPKS